MVMTDCRDCARPYPRSRHYESVFFIRCPLFNCSSVHPLRPGRLLWELIDPSERAWRIWVNTLPEAERERRWREWPRQEQ